MSHRLYHVMTINNWKRIARITPQQAAAHTAGNTDKFMTNSFWLIGEWGFTRYVREAHIPVGAQAVHYREPAWYLVEKVK